MSDGKWQGGGPTFWEDAKPYPERRTLERWLEQQILIGALHGSNYPPSWGILTGKIVPGADHAALIQWR